MKKRQSPLVLLTLVAVFVPLFGQNAGLGRIDFPNSGAPEAQEAFRRGVLLLHSFEYEDAREAFREAIKTDSDFAMAYWGEAMTYNHPIWNQVDLEAAREVLDRLGTGSERRLARAPTEREKDWLRTLDALYGEGEKPSRDSAWAEAMGALREKYPQDLEAAAFYSLALLGTCQGERDIPTYMRAAAVAEEVFAANPQHPGAAHYLIHSYDDPVHAPLGLRAARVYARIAAAAPHALHMPSHIFVAMGMWGQVASSNEDSWAASEERVLRKGLTVEDRGYHALWWLHYAYLQQGRFEDARKLLKTMEEDAARSGSRRTRTHLAYMRAEHIVEGRDEDAASIQVDLSELSPSAAGADLLATGMSALRRNDVKGAEQALAKLKEVAVGDRARSARIMEKELSALLSARRGDPEAALSLMREAVEMEDALSFDFGPPDPVKPSHELFGEMLLEMDRPEEAARQFQLALKRAPRRALSLQGLASALERSGRKDEAEHARRELHKFRQATEP